METGVTLFLEDKFQRGQYAGYGTLNQQLAGLFKPAFDSGVCEEFGRDWLGALLIFWTTQWTYNSLRLLTVSLIILMQVLFPISK